MDSFVGTYHPPFCLDPTNVMLYIEAICRRSLSKLEFFIVAALCKNSIA